MMVSLIVMMKAAKDPLPVKKNQQPKAPAMATPMARLKMQEAAMARVKATPMAQL